MLIALSRGSVTFVLISCLVDALEEGVLSLLRAHGEIPVVAASLLICESSGKFNFPTIRGDFLIRREHASYAKHASPFKTT